MWPTYVDAPFTFNPKASSSNPMHWTSDATGAGWTCITITKTNNSLFLSFYKQRQNCRFPTNVKITFPWHVQALPPSFLPFFLPSFMLYLSVAIELSSFIPYDCIRGNRINRQLINSFVHSFILFSSPCCTKSCAKSLGKSGKVFCFGWEFLLFFCFWILCLYVILDGCLWGFRFEAVFCWESVYPIIVFFFFLVCFEDGRGLLMIVSFLGHSNVWYVGYNERTLDKGLFLDEGWEMSLYKTQRRNCFHCFFFVFISFSFFSPSNFHCERLYFHAYTFSNFRLWVHVLMIWFRVHFFRDHILLDIQFGLFIVDFISLSASWVFLLFLFSLNSYQLFEHCFSFFKKNLGMTI